MVDTDVSPAVVAAPGRASAAVATRPPRRRLGALLVVFGMVAGLAVRVVVMRTSIGVLDSDEAVVGLMARQFTLGHFRAFFWGQAYGGTLETVLSGSLFRVFGSSLWALRVVPLALNAVAAVLVWRVGRRLITRRGAVVAAMLVWLWPANYLWWSIKARGFYEATLCLTLICALLALRIADEEGRRWLDWALFGLCAGLGWWQTPQIAYIVAPIGIWLIVVRRVALRPALAVLPGLVFGALPWLVANLSSGFASLVPPPAPHPSSYGDHLVMFFQEHLPMTLGLKVVYLSRWTTGPIAGGILYGAAVVAIVIGVFKRGRAGLLIGGVILAYPFLNALLTLSGVVNEGRYTLFLLPWLVIAMVRGARRPAATALLVAAAIAVSAVGLDALRGQTSPYAPDVHVPTSMAALEQSLHDHGVHRAWANYWVAYRLTFETRGEIIAAPVTNGRYAPYYDAVSSFGRPAFIFIAGSRGANAFWRGLIVRHIRYGGWRLGATWVVYVPAVPLAPTAIPGTGL